MSNFGTSGDPLSIKDLESPPSIQTSPAMPSKAAIQAALRAFVEQLARAHSPAQYDQCADRCEDYHHDLFGPYLQYKKDNFHLGRWYVLVCLIIILSHRVSITKPGV